MKKLLVNALVLGSTVALAACASDNYSRQDETLTQAPYAEERTVGSAPAKAAPVRSAEPVFESRQTK